MSTILTLLAVALNEQPLTRPITARFDANGGTIGRADHCTLALPDPERFISRKQAEIVFTAGGFVIRNVGAANPILVGRRSLAQGETAVVQHGDEVRIGGYELRAQCESPVAAVPAAGEARAPGGDFSSAIPPADPRIADRTPPAFHMTPSAPLPAAPDRPAALSAAERPASDAGATANPFGDLLGGAAPTDSNPFADLLAPVATPATPATPAVPATSPAFVPAASVAPVAAPPPVMATVPSVHARSAAPPGASPMPPPQATPSPPVRHDFGGLIPPPSGLAAASAAFAAAAPSAARLPDDFDPFRSPETHKPAWADGAARPADDPFADLLPAGVAPNVDLAFDLPVAAAGDDPLARFMSGSAPAPGTPAPGTSSPDVGGLTTDPLALLGFAADERAAAPAGPPQPDDLPALHGAFAPPGVASAAPRQTPQIPTIALPAASNSGFGAPAPAPPPVPAPAAAPSPATPSPATPIAASPAPAAWPPAAVSTRGAAGAEPLWRAFCDGAGISLQPPTDSTEERMRMIGRVLRAAVDGTLQLMAVRASTKSEMRAAVTQIQARSNNPLKFAPDGATGVEQLVQPAARGFLEGPAAMQDAMFDLVGHSIGSVQGMRAALEGMLDHFDPTELETKLGAGRLLDSLLPMNRKARLWELYLQHYRAIREEAQEDFHSLFGKAFVAAYEQQVERLKARSGP